MSSPEKHAGGVVVALLQACPACDGPIRGTLDRCPKCDTERPATGWLPVGSDVSITLTDELEDDPDTATSAPPPVVPADVPKATRAAAPREPAPPITPMGVYVRFFGIFALSTTLTAVLIVGLGTMFLPPAPSTAPTAPAPITVVVPAVQEAPVDVVVENVQPDTLLGGEEEGVAEPAPQAVAPASAPVAVVAPAPVPAPAPVAAPTTPAATAGAEPAQVPQPASVAPAPSPSPSPVVAPAPVAPLEASALSGTYIGKADGDPISMELTFAADQRLMAVLRVAGRDGTEVHQVSGTYTVAPDGSADFALTDRTDDGVVGYSGSVAGSEARGIVTVDGRRRGRFSVGK